MLQDGNTVVAQRKRILAYLHTHPLDTLTARKELDVMHPAARVMELRKQGIGIITTKIDRPSDCGKIHTVACYVLKVGAAATAPNHEEDRIQTKESKPSKLSTGGAI